jgi:hypothetical protein
LGSPPRAKVGGIAFEVDGHRDEQVAPASAEACHQRCPGEEAFAHTVGHHERLSRGVLDLRLAEQGQAVQAVEERTQDPALIAAGPVSESPVGRGLGVAGEHCFQILQDVDRAVSAIGRAAVATQLASLPAKVLVFHLLQGEEVGCAEALEHELGQRLQPGPVGSEGGRDMRRPRVVIGVSRVVEGIEQVARIERREAERTPLRSERWRREQSALSDQRTFRHREPPAPPPVRNHPHHLAGKRIEGAERGKDRREVGCAQGFGGQTNENGFAHPRPGRLAAKDARQRPRR